MRGTCLQWSGSLTGTITRSLDPLGNAPRFSVQASVSSTGGVVTFSGTAVDASGSPKTITGTSVTKPHSSPEYSDRYAGN